ncbi:MAG: hypothetical protein K8L99_03345 [Anaerolineae bacterium]|nr:hypothetical protein [Anaerolineae bacterium]
MEEELWQIQRQSHRLQEFRIEIQGLWDDDAARHINLAMLNPHQDDDADMVKAFGDQHNNLNECEHHRELAVENADTASELSREFNEIIERVDEDIEVAIQFEQQYHSFRSESQRILAEVDPLISQAKEAIQGAPAYES